MSGVEPGWVVVSSGAATRADRPVRRRRVFAQVILAAVVVLVAVALAGLVAARKLAESEATTDAAKTADLFAETLVQPVITDGLVDGDPTAVAAVDRVVKEHLIGQQSIVRVKLWDRSGKILYSDEARLIGQQFDLDREEAEVFTNPQIRAEVSDLQAPENIYERDSGKLLETYRPVWTPDGTPLLFEAYFSYDVVTARSAQIWRGFAGVTLSSLLVLMVLLLPVVWRLLDRLRKGQHQREALLQRAVDASGDERRRIAGTLHDGVVQDLVGTSFTVSGSAERAAASGQPELAAQLRSAAGTVRGSIAGLRSLLVDIYPPSLATAGLHAALSDLAAGMAARGLTVTVDVPDWLDLDAAGQRLAYRVTKECLTNAAQHSAAAHASVGLTREAGGWRLDIIDAGAGFDAAATLAAPPEGHFGLRVLADVAADAGATLRVSSAAGHGTHWEMTWPSDGSEPDPRPDADPEAGPDTTQNLEPLRSLGIR